MRRLFSHHEITMLLVLFSSSGHIAVPYPDNASFQQESLVALVIPPLSMSCNPLSTCIMTLPST